MLDGRLCVIGMTEQHRAFADGDIGRGLSAVLPCPGIDVFEERLVGVENVSVGKPLDACKPVERNVELRQKRRVLDEFDFSEVFLPLEISLISPRLEVAERIERHGLASLR